MILEIQDFANSNCSTVEILDEQSHEHSAETEWMSIIDGQSAGSNLALGLDRKKRALNPSKER
jgi:hypothetical protein